MAEWFLREAHNILVADRMRDIAEFSRIRGLYQLFLIALYRAAFCRVLARVSEEQLRLCVKK